MPRDVTPVSDGPLNDLFWSFNHYLSTGDNIGEGVGDIRGETVTVVLLISLENPVDIEDWERLRSRLAEIEAHGGPTVKIEARPGMPRFDVYTAAVNSADVPALCRLLQTPSASVPFGSPFSVIEKVDPSLRRVSRAAGVSPNAVRAPTTQEGIAILEELRRTVPTDVFEDVMRRQPLYWYVRGVLWLDDPKFGDPMPVDSTAGIEPAVLDIAQRSGVPIGDVHATTGGEMRAAMEGKVASVVLDLATAEPARYWEVRGRYWLDNPNFGEPAAIDELAYDDTLGLHRRAV